MFDHIGLHVKDLAASVRFYEAALAPLGFVLCSRDETSAGFGPKDAPALWLYADKQATAMRTHLAFRAEARKAVDQFHGKGIKAGGKDNGEPAYALITARPTTPRSWSIPMATTSRL